MYGITNFEEKVEKAMADGRLKEHMAAELEPIPWPKERTEMMPKLWRDRKFVYKPDRLSEFLIDQQESAQAFQARLIGRFGMVNSGYSYILQRLENKLEDRDLIPTLGLSSLAGIVSWGSNSTLILPVKVLLASGGAVLSASLTHRRLRGHLIDQTTQIIPDEIFEKFNVIDERIGQLGAQAWTGVDDAFTNLKLKVKNKFT